MNRMQNGFELTKQSWSALMQNKQLLVFPLISLIATTLIAIAFFVPISATGIVQALAEESGTVSNTAMIATFVLLFLFYLATNFVIIFSNTALIGATLKLLRGEPATVKDGIDLAMSRLSTIFVYALISATVGMIAKSIRESGRNSDNILVSILAAIIGGLIQGAWNLVVFFAIPIFAAENVGPIEAMKRSVALFKQTWGEGFTGSTAIGFASCLVSIVLLVVGGLLIFGAAATGSTVLVVGAVVLVVLAFAALSLIQGAINGVFQASLYEFARTGNAGKFIDTELARTAFPAGPAPTSA